MVLNVLTAQPTLIAALLMNLTSFKFVDADQDTLLIHSIKSATLAVPLNTMTTYLVLASLAQLAQPAVALLMASFPSAPVLQVTLLMLITKCATSVPLKSTITLPLVNVAHAQNVLLDASSGMEFSQFLEPPEASLGTLLTRSVIHHA